MSKSTAMRCATWRITILNDQIRLDTMSIRLYLLAEMAKTRAIRISDEEEKLIQEFLKQNPFIDFSTLARMAIRRFVENPHLEVKGVQSKSKKVEAHQ